jgi:hypothetical protein
MASIAILSLLMGLLVVVGPSGAGAQQSMDNLSGAPVDIHEGSCDDFLQEPAYDGGDVEVQSLSDLRDSDDFVDSGLTEVGNTLGVDVNGDGTIDDSETIGAVDGDAQVAVAETDIGDEVDTSKPYVAVLHAGADTYDTVLACGSITDAAEDDDGNLIAYMHPVGDATTFGYAVLNSDHNHITTYLFEPGTAPEQPAAAGGEEATPTVAEGYPVDIHRGTCADWTTEPAYDVGQMQKTNVAAEGEQEVGDTDAALPDNASQLGDVYEVDQDVEFTGSELLDEGPYVVGVHKSQDEYDTLIACGNVFDIPEDNDLVVPLQPVGDSNMTGVALIGTDDQSLAAFLWSCEPLQPAEHATPAPTPTVEPSPTTVPSAVVEQTQVVEATEVVEATKVVTETQVVETTKVVTETEVVPAPTATAQAGG